MTTPPPAPATPRRSNTRWVWAIIIVLLIATGAFFAGMEYAGRPEPQLAKFPKIPVSQKLADGYADADNDLIADAPTDPAKLQKVEEIGFCLVPGDDSKETQADWKDLMDAIHKATGKKVVFRAGLADLEAQLAAIRVGKVQVAGFSTGEVSWAINNAGFVPLASPADAAGKYSYEMEILVPAASPVKSPADLKGKTVALTVLASNSGARAPLVILKDEFKLLPGRDYNVVWTGSHDASIKRITQDHAPDAVCVANDMMARAVQTGALKPEQVRSIYKSGSFPPLCLGVAHNLPPAMTAQIRKALDDFRFAGTSLEKRYGQQGKVRFAPVDYKKDWAYVRDIDNAVTRLTDGP